MTREDFYHSRPMTFLQRLVSVGYGTCGCCGMPWNFISKHGGDHTIMINKYEGFFPVCEYCWTHKSYEQNKSAVTKLLKMWEEHGVIHYNPSVYSNAFENDWNKTHNNKKNNMEEKITAWVAREQDGTMSLYVGGKPFKGKNFWKLHDPEEIGVEYLSKKSFPQVKWEDEEPTKVELTIKICE